MARAGQVKSLILNLMVNALEAQPQGGELDVRSELSRGLRGLGARWLRFASRTVGEVCLARSETGSSSPSSPRRPGARESDWPWPARRPGKTMGRSTWSRFPCRGGAEFVVVFPLAAADSRPARTPPLATAGRQERSARWSAVPRRARDPQAGSRVRPAHLMTPEGLEAVLALSHRTRRRRIEAFPHHARGRRRGPAAHSGPSSGRPGSRGPDGRIGRGCPQPDRRVPSRSRLHRRADARDGRVRASEEPPERPVRTSMS